MVWVLLMASLLSACAVVQPIAPLPTLLPTAVIPIQPDTSVAVNPAPFTPSGANIAEVPVPPVSPSPMPNPMQTSQPETTIAEMAVSPPTINPILLTPVAGTSVYRETPPQTIDCGEHGLLLRSQFPSDVGGPWRGYHAYLPPCYGEDGRSYPTLYLFHGSIQTDTHWVELGLIQQIEAGLRDGRYPPFIVIMPFNGELGNSTSGNYHSIEGVTVNVLLPYVDEMFCTWHEAAGRSIGGISRGGYWALMIAFRHPALFTAVAGHSSHLRYETDRAEYNPLSTYVDADLSNLRIWMDWGENDFLRLGQIELRNSLIAVDANLQATVNPGGHNDEYWQAHIIEYLDWHTAVWPLDRMEYPSCHEQ
jgi:enterochelin esterase-like enzyme